MKAICGFAVLLLLGVQITELKPVDERLIWQKAMENPDMFEGDIDLGGVDISDRNAIKLPGFKWPNGVIIYQFEDNIQDRKADILKVMRYIESVTCIKFKERTDEVDYVNIRKGSGCHSKVGFMHMGPQELSLGVGCSRFASMLHELTHAIGFYHEHTRSDRDNYIIIHWDNIRKGYEDQFKKTPKWMHELLEPFDMESIMLYGDTVYSKDYESKTMESKDPNNPIPDLYEKTKYSRSNIRAINKLYCPERVTD